VQNIYLGRSIHVKTRQVLPPLQTSANAAVLFALCGMSHAAHAQQQSDSPPSAPEEILVTAQKRVENLQEVPVPVTVLSADSLAERSQVLLRDYFDQVPALAVTPSYEGNQYLTIRGIATGGTTTPTVGVMVDDVPYGSSTAGEGNLAPDIDPGDLARIEVLRGPQGTLYGANSMGGLLKFVTKDPSTQGYGGRIEAGTNYVHNGAEPGFNIRASANVPLGDTFAIRLSGFNRQDPGYIDNPVTQVDGVNKVEAYGARLSALWKPSVDLSVRLSALYQDLKSKGLPQVIVQPGLWGLQQNYIPGTGQYDKTVEAFSATLDYKLGGVNLTSVTGYNLNRYPDVIDFTFIDGAPARKFYGVSAGVFNDYTSTSKFTQEIRLSGAIGRHFDWLLGGFYTHEHVTFDQHREAHDLTTGRFVGELGFATFPTAYKEYAAFADLTYHVTDRFDVQLGSRESHSEVTNLAEIQTGLLFNAPSTVITVPAVESNANSFTYLVTPRFKLSDDIMMYARLASGYRPGGPNAGIAVAQGAPSAFSPDKTQNYEVGAKGDFFDHSLSLDASVYYIDWKDIQLKLDTPQNFGYQGNGGNAKSQGVELSVESRPLTGLSIVGWVAYDDAVITHPPANAAVYLYPGARLAYSSRWSGNVSLEQDFHLWDSAIGFVGGQVSYVGDRLGIFTGKNGVPAPRQAYPGYTREDLRAGVKYESWTTNIYVNNVADRRGLVGGGLGFFPPSAFIYIQPRTIGLNVSKRF
jgi:iron complex outermembrane receptor protein